MNQNYDPNPREKVQFPIVPSTDYNPLEEMSPREIALYRIMEQILQERKAKEATVNTAEENKRQARRARIMTAHKLVEQLREERGCNGNHALDFLVNSRGTQNE